MWLCGFAFKKQNIKGCVVIMDAGPPAMIPFALVQEALGKAGPGGGHLVV